VPDEADYTSRRHMLQWLGASAVPLVLGGNARAAALPLKTTGLEHYGMTVPDPEAAAKFYGKIFDLDQSFQGSGIVMNIEGSSCPPSRGSPWSGGPTAGGPRC